MEKARTSNLWFIRVDGDYETLQKHCQSFVNKIDVVRCLAYYHTGEKKENPHMHMVIEVRTVTQKQSFALRVKQTFTNIEKKSQYALTIWDGDETKGAVSYMFHEEGTKELINKGFSQAALCAARAANDAVQRVVQMNKEKASNKLVDSAIEEFSKIDGYVDKFSIFRFMMQRIKEGDNYHPGMYKLKQYVEEVQIRIASAEQFESICVENYRNLFN